MTERRYKNPQVNLRIPVEVKEALTELAEANGRSVNAEMVAALEAWALKNQHIRALDLASVAERLIALEAEVAEIKKKPT